MSRIMTREEAARWMEFMMDQMPKEPPEGCDYSEEWADSHNVVLQAYRVAIQSLLTEPSDDAVSRQAVERLTWEEPSYSDSLNALTEVRVKVRSLPSVTPTYNFTTAEVVNILTYLQADIENHVLATDISSLVSFLEARESCVALIQQKINELKGVIVK